MITTYSNFYSKIIKKLFFGQSAQFQCLANDIPTNFSDFSHSFKLNDVCGNYLTQDVNKFILKMRKPVIQVSLFSLN